MIWVLPTCVASHGAAPPHVLCCLDVLNTCSFFTTHPVLSLPTMPTSSFAPPPCPPPPFLG